MVWFIQTFSEFREQKNVWLAWKIFTINLGVFIFLKTPEQPAERGDSKCLKSWTFLSRCSHSAYMLQPTMGQHEEEIRQEAGYIALSAFLK